LHGKEADIVPKANFPARLQIFLPICLGLGFSLDIFSHFDIDAKQMFKVLPKSSGTIDTLGDKFQVIRFLNE
jgi:hypothetical protein